MARYLTLSSVARRFLFGVAVLLAASSAVVAEPVTLNCSFNSRDAAGTANIILDEAAGTITIYYPPMNTPPSQYPQGQVCCQILAR